MSNHEANIVQDSKDVEQTKVTIPLTLWLRATLLPTAERISNLLVIGGFLAIAGGVAMIYLPAGIMVAGVLSLALAKLIAAKE